MLKAIQLMQLQNELLGLALEEEAYPEARDEIAKRRMRIERTIREFLMQPTPINSFAKRNGYAVEFILDNQEVEK